jgi:hypothetical protein
VDAVHRRLAQNIRERAKARRIKVTHLPDRAAVGPTHFFAVLKGESSPTVEWLTKIAKALDCDPADLLAKSQVRS